MFFSPQFFFFSSKIYQPEKQGFLDDARINLWLLAKKQKQTHDTSNILSVNRRVICAQHQKSNFQVQNVL